MISAAGVLFMHIVQEHIKMNLKLCWMIGGSLVRHLQLPYDYTVFILTLHIM
jgi:hypothetical protein